MKQSRIIAALVLVVSQILAVLFFFGRHSFAADSTPATPYVRISRAFFEKPLRAEVKLAAADGSAPSSYPSPVEWIQYPPVAPSPQPSDPALGQVLADFRDFVACAQMTALGQSRLCFKVMGDVSNLGLNDNEMTLRGIETISSDASYGQCVSATLPASPAPGAPAKPAADGGPASRYKIQKASVTSNALELDFKHSDGCGPNVQLTLTQLP